MGWSMFPSFWTILTIPGAILLSFVENAASKSITHMPQEMVNRTISNERVIALAKSEKSEGYSILLCQAHQRHMPFVAIHQDTGLVLGIRSATQVQTILHRPKASRARIRRGPRHRDFVVRYLSTSGGIARPGGTI